MVGVEKKRRRKKKTRRRDTRVGRIRDLLNQDIDEFILLWEFGSCPCRRQNQDRVCVSLRRAGRIGCRASQVRARSDELSCPLNHPRSPPYRDFDASCKTSWLRARKRLTPRPRAECLLSPQSSRMPPSDLRVFGFWTSEQQRQMRQAAATQRQKTLWQQDGWAKAVAHTACVRYDCCTGQHKVVNKGARRWYGFVIWLTSDATSMCVEADQEHLSLMGEHCLSWSLPPSYHGKRSHALVTQCVHVRACKNSRGETGWCLFVPTNMAPLLQK